jgi:RNA polymerase sigma-70 factor (ECF subfamily)
MDDDFLIQKTLDGSGNAFKLLVIRYQRMIFSFLTTFNFPRPVIEDLAQDTFFRAYKSLSSYDRNKGATFPTWLFTIAKNLALNEKSREQTRKKKIMDIFFRKEDIHSGPENNLEMKGLRSKIQRALNLVPFDFRTAVILSYFDDLSLKEIAGIENCSIGTVKSRIFRGKQLLRTILSKEDFQ